jgi:hypothetical protein
MIRQMRLAAILSFTISIIYILLQSLQPSFYMHLFPDVFVFHARATYFWENLSLKDLGHNEYQPGAIVFFILVGLVFMADQSLETFKWGLFAANTGLLIFTAFLFYKMKRYAGIIVLSVLLLALGPILLFRFDLLVIFLLILVFYFWEKKYFGLAMAILPLGVLVKVYPVIFLPYLLFLGFKKYRTSNIIYHEVASFAYLFSIFLSSLLTYFLLYTIVFQVSFNDTLISYNFHNLKSVATESVWASAIYFIHLIQGIPFPSMESDFGINAISRREIYPSIFFYNYFWVLPLGLLNLFYFWKYRKGSHEINYQFIILNLLTFLIFSKVFSNQYWAWLLFLIPLLDLKTFVSRKWVINLFLILLTTILHTFIYPLNYSEWLRVLNEKNLDFILVSAMLISSFILPVVAVRIAIDVFKNKE